LACLEKKLTQRARRTQRKTGKGQGSPRKRKDMPDKSPAFPENRVRTEGTESTEGSSSEHAWERQLLSWLVLKKAHTEGAENTEAKLARNRVLPEKEKTCRTKVRRSQKTGCARRAKRALRGVLLGTLGNANFKVGKFLLFYECSAFV